MSAGVGIFFIAVLSFRFVEVYQHFTGFAMYFPLQTIQFCEESAYNENHQEDKTDEEDSK
ncbi:hypothetical protein F230042K4_00830 [Mediterraneibacter glycyrrhizinilyticus]